MYEITYVAARLARVRAQNRELAKSRFAAYVLYDDGTHVESDVELSFGDEANVTQASEAAPTGGSRSELRAWLAHREGESQAFEAGLYEDPERRLDAYLRLLATNDPWRLEGHGSLGRTLSTIPIFAQLETYDGRIRYRFDATQYLDYLRIEGITSLDPLRPWESLRVDALVDVSALHDDGLRQIASSYQTIARERRLTARFCAQDREDEPYTVTFEAQEWGRYVSHRLAQPERFLPPPGWVSAFPSYGDSG